MAKHAVNTMETVLCSLKLFNTVCFLRGQWQLWADEELHVEEHWSQYLVGTNDVSEVNESEGVLPGLLQDLKSHAWWQSHY